MADDTTAAETPAAAPDTGTDEVTEPIARDDDWQTKARKHERDLKKARKEADELRTQLDGIASASQSEQEKAIEQARKEARQEALTEAQQERRNDRLEVAVTRLAARSFADTEDALLHVQRAVTAGDIDADDIFDEDGKVKSDALQAKLDELLERKPHLKSDPGGFRPTGTADAGRGTPVPEQPDMAHNDLLLQIAGLKR